MEQSAQRITIKSLIAEAVHAISHVEHGLRKTLIALLKEPDKMIPAYLAGNRAPYQKPFGFLLLSTTLYAIILHFAHLATGMPDSMPLTDNFNAKLAFNAAHLETAYYSWLHIGLLPVYGLLSFVIFFPSKYNYAEWLVVCCYIVSFLLLILIPYQIVYAIVGFNEMSNFIIQLMIVTLYTGFATRSFITNRTTESFLRGFLLGGILFTIFYFTVRGIAWYITLNN